MHIFGGVESSITFCFILTGMGVIRQPLYLHNVGVRFAYIHSWTPLWDYTGCVVVEDSEFIFLNSELAA